MLDCGMHMGYNDDVSQVFSPLYVQLSTTGYCPDINCWLLYGRPLLSSCPLQTTIHPSTTGYCPSVHYWLLSNHQLLITVWTPTTGYCPAVHYRILSSRLLQATVQLFTTRYCPAVHYRILSSRPLQATALLSTTVVVVVVVNFIKHQNRAITGERVAARAAPSYQYAMVLVIIT